MLLSVATTLLLAGGALARPSQNHDDDHGDDRGDDHGHGHDHGCARLGRGNFNINRYQLYPENADWDDKNCLVYFGYAPIC